MAVLETVVQYSEAGDAHAPALAHHLLPALAGLLASRSESQDLRFWALKLLWELTARLLLPPLPPSPDAAGATDRLPSTSGWGPPFAMPATPVRASVASKMSSKTSELSARKVFVSTFTCVGSYVHGPAQA